MSASPRQAPAPAALRRGWCPSALKPMETGDGWLVRLHPPGGVLTPAQLGRIAALAARHGNGLVEISARANLQIRGVRLETHPALVAALLAERLVEEHDGDGPQRLTLLSPLAGASKPAAPDLSASPRLRWGRESGGAPVDILALAEAIELAGRAVPGLPSKTLVVVDDGGAISLDGVAADIRVRGVASDRVAIGLAHALWLGPVPGSAAAGIVAVLLAGLAVQHRHAPDRVRRMRDLAPVALAGLAAATGLRRMATPEARPAPRRAGLFDLAGASFAAMIGLPFGRCDAATLARLGERAKLLGAGTLRLSPWRGLACLGLPREAATAWLDEADALGLITHDDDPRLAIQACAGKPACLRGETQAMADAAEIAAGAAPLLAAGLSLHVSGCVKSCAHPGRADLTLVGREGRYDVVFAGTTRDASIATLDLSEIMRRLQPGQDLFARLQPAGLRLEPGL